jgi:hypothetical protein
MSRLLSPAGFVAVGLLFFLPFLTVACGNGAEPAITTVFAGTDLLLGGDPDVVLSPEASLGEEPTSEGEEHVLFVLKQHLGIESFDRQPFAIAAAAVLALGLLTMLIRERLARHASAIGVAVLAGALLVAAYLRAAGAIDDGMVVLGEAAGTPLAHTTAPAVGFWLMIGTLNLLVIGHAMALARAWPGGHATADAPAG